MEEQESKDVATDEQADAHRGFVREMNKSFSSVYGYGGMAVIAASAAVPLVGWQLGVLGSPVTWSLAVVALLVGLFVVRIFVRRRAQRLRDRIRKYCEINDISAEALRERFGEDSLYPFFASIFKVVERRESMRKHQ
jgi:hypothetical protein